MKNTEIQVVVPGGGGVVVEGRTVLSELMNTWGFYPMSIVLFLKLDGGSQELLNYSLSLIVYYYFLN